MLSCSQGVGISWREVLAAMEPHYSKRAGRRPPVGMERLFGSRLLVTRRFGRRRAALLIEFSEHLPLLVPNRRQLVILQPLKGQRHRLPTGKQGQDDLR